MEFLSALFQSSRKWVENADLPSSISTNRNAKSATARGKENRTETRSKKRRRRCAQLTEKEEEEEESIITSERICFSNDILRQVFGFLVSSGEHVDVQSLRSVMFVCRQWNEVATSQSLWRQPRGYSSTDDIKTAIALRNPVPSSDSSGCSSAIDDELSFIGFTKKGTVEKGRRGDASNIYRARERAHGSLCILSVGPKDGKSSQLLNHIYEGHFFQEGTSFISPLHNDDFMQQVYPRGIMLLGGHVVRWYEDGNSQAIFPRPVFQPRLKLERRGIKEYNDEKDEGLLDRNDFFLERLRLCHCLDHLRKLERSNEDRMFREYIPLYCRAIIVDWISEVAQCFDLEARIAFQAMRFFRQFLSKVQGKVAKSHYQLTVSACLLIASKCNLSKIKPTDLIYGSDTIFTARDLAATEEMVLEALDWRLGFSTVVDFVFAYSKVWIIRPSSREMKLMRYLSELALQSQIDTHYEDSLIAASIVALARFCLGQNKPLWKKELQKVTGFTFENLCDCIIDLSTALEGIREDFPNLTCISRRFRGPEWDGVAYLAIPTIASSVVLVAYQARAN